MTQSGSQEQPTQGCSVSAVSWKKRPEEMEFHPELKKIMNNYKDKTDAE